MKPRVRHVMWSDRMMDRTEAMGAKAALAGTARDANPFPKDSEPYFVWDMGWLEREHSEAGERLAGAATP